jgi:hypothetical protein
MEKDYVKKIVTEHVDSSHIQDIGQTNLKSLIARLQSVLDSVPAEHREAATLEVLAYDWEGVDVFYNRQMTDAEYQEHVAVVDAQRKATDGPLREDWIRNVRMNGPMGPGAPRDWAVSFIRDNPESNRFHPDLVGRA